MYRCLYLDDLKIVVKRWNNEEREEKYFSIITLQVRTFETTIRQVHLKAGDWRLITVKADRDILWRQGRSFVWLISSRVLFGSPQIQKQDRPRLSSKFVSQNKKEHKNHGQAVLPYSKNVTVRCLTNLGQFKPTRRKLPDIFLEKLTNSNARSRGCRNRWKDMTEDPAPSNLVELITCNSLKAIALAPIQV